MRVQPLLELIDNEDELLANRYRRAAPQLGNRFGERYVGRQVGATFSNALEQSAFGFVRGGFDIDDGYGMRNHR